MKKKNTFLKFSWHHVALSYLSLLSCQACPTYWQRFGFSKVSLQLPAATLSSFVSPERESRDVTSPRRPFVCCRSHVLHSLQSMIFEIRMLLLNPPTKMLRKKPFYWSSCSWLEFWFKDKRKKLYVHSARVKNSTKHHEFVAAFPQRPKPPNSTNQSWPLAS